MTRRETAESVKILFDQGTPVPLRRELTGHQVSTAYLHQQNLGGMRLAILVLPTTSWPRIQAHASEVIAAVDRLSPGDFCELTFDA